MQSQHVQSRPAQILSLFYFFYTLYVLHLQAARLWMLDLLYFIILFLPGLVLQISQSC